MDVLLVSTVSEIINVRQTEKGFRKVFPYLIFLKNKSFDRYLLIPS